ncbi:mandelate racemase/muconate lactonizing enzyme family protein [Tranquillimonas alkanivorans]|uniref:L-alanine-DL-glutamate epimerase n=1 Tax=Tranquillimonas alkanivorans TaxID=441119 RepID=A0A1I5VJZ3_9RHOB|nr:mandelate racemase/muconate lactonizing enzyme family protein [Tranquillimonas alkanivorans]SFQ07898.1 L-alanine-DL-glutamate epimerase [Tranquillimonas alkanivorans]
MAKIDRIEIAYVDLAPKVVRTDAIQAFVSQQTPIVTITDTDGASGTGYTYTIGTGGTAVLAHLHDDLAPKLKGMDAANIEAVWRTLKYHTHATTPGAITALALAAIDTALWDLKAKRAGLPLWQLAGGARESIPLYTTEGGWLHIETEALVDDAVAASAKGFRGCKVKVGKPDPQEDVARLSAVRDAVGSGFEIFTDANQAFRVDEAIRRARLLEPLDIGWLEEPLLSDDIDSHARLCASTTLPVAVGESIYSASWFREYMQRGACSVVQVDVARIGGITPWLKVAHAAETFNIAVCPHFLMELHVSLCCAVPNARWLEYIPQLDTITAEPMRIENGHGVPSPAPGLGLAWDWDAIGAQRAADPIQI